LKLTSKQRQYLRGLAHSLNPYIIIGKNGLNSSSIKSIEKSLTDHELIKVRVQVGDKKKLAPIIQDKTSCSVVGIIGKILILYRFSPDKGEEGIKI
tara:strand:+ start:114 stop:401 length:288 start_codon:yes stop_codon:yes gene_type:complete